MTESINWSVGFCGFPASLLPWVKMKLFDALFAIARSEITRSVDLDMSSKAEWVRLLGLTKPTLNKILIGKAVSDSVKIAVMNGFFRDQFRLFANLLFRLTEGDSVELERLHEHVGKSIYLRRTSTGNIAKGRIIVEHSDGLFSFKNIPDLDADGNHNTTPLHEGIVLQQGGRTLFVGVGSRYVRTMMTYNTDRLANAVSRGLVLTTDSTHGHPMASIIFMAHESFRKINEFEGEYSQNFDKRIKSLDRDDFIGVLKV